MRRRKRWLKIETGIGIAGLLVALIATAFGPALHLEVTKDELAAESGLRAERIEVLEALLLTSHRNNNALRAQLAENNLLRNKAYAQLGGLIEQVDIATKEREILKTQFAEQRGELQAQLADAKERIKELDGDLKLANAKLAQTRELASRYALANERDAAVDKAKRAEERIRELTLQLHRSGLWP